MAGQNRGEEEDYGDWENSDFEPNPFGVDENGNGNQIPRQEQSGSLPPVSSLSNLSPRNLSPQNQASGELGQFNDFGPPVLSQEVVLSQGVVSPQHTQYQMERQDFQGQNFQGQYYGQSYSQVSIGGQGNLTPGSDYSQVSIQGQRNLAPGQSYSQVSPYRQGNLTPERNLAFGQGNQGQNLGPIRGQQGNFPPQYSPYLSPQNPYPNSNISQYQQGHISPPTSSNVPFFPGFVPNDPYAQAPRITRPQNIGPQLTSSPQQFGKVSPPNSDGTSPILAGQFSIQEGQFSVQGEILSEEEKRAKNRDAASRSRKKRLMDSYQMTFRFEIIKRLMEAIFGPEAKKFFEPLLDTGFVSPIALHTETLKEKVEYFPQWKYEDLIRWHPNMKEKALELKQNPNTFQLGICVERYLFSLENPQILEQIDPMAQKKQKAQPKQGEGKRRGRKPKNSCSNVEDSGSDKNDFDDDGPPPKMQKMTRGRVQKSK